MKRTIKLLAPTLLLVACVKAPISQPDKELIKVQIDYNGSLLTIPNVPLRDGVTEVIFLQDTVEVTFHVGIDAVFEGELSTTGIR